MPVGATTTTLRSVSEMNRRISVDLPVPALPVRNRCRPPANSASARSNSSVSTSSRSDTVILLPLAPGHDTAALHRLLPLDVHGFEVAPWVAFHRSVITPGGLAWQP